MREKKRGDLLHTGYGWLCIGFSDLLLVLVLRLVDSSTSRLTLGYLDSIDTVGRRGLFGCVEYLIGHPHLFSLWSFMLASLPADHQTYPRKTHTKNPSPIYSIFYVDVPFWPVWSRYNIRTPSNRWSTGTFESIRTKQKNTSGGSSAEKNQNGRNLCFLFE